MITYTIYWKGLIFTLPRYPFYSTEQKTSTILNQNIQNNNIK